MSQAGADMDRRTAPRKEPSAPLRAHLMLELDSAVRSLSSGGMMVRVAFPPAVDTVHTFVLEFEAETLRLTGIVRYVKPVIQPGPPRYDVGIEFQELDPAAGAFLERFVDSRT